MPERRRFYLTTAIAYANNRPGLHTLYEVVGGRRHRALAPDARRRHALPDGHRRVLGQHRHDRADAGKTPKAFVDEMVALFRTAEDALGIAPDRFIRTTDPDHGGRPRDHPARPCASATSTWAATRAGTARTRASSPGATWSRTPRASIAPTTPASALQWLTERNWFFRLSRYQDAWSATTPPTPIGSSQTTGATRCWASWPRAWRTSPSAASRLRWGLPWPIREDGTSARLPDGAWDPAAGTVYVWFDALINYITGAGFPDDAEAFAHWWPADLHVIGKDINRLHTIIWPAMLMSAGLPLPRLVWVHGWLLTQGERMSKSRGNFLDPVDVVRALGQDGTRFALLREVAFDRDSDVSWDSFVRRYNADLANDFGNLVNRTVTMAARYLEGERPAPEGRGPLHDAWPGLRSRYAAALDGYLLHEALAALWELVAAANRYVDAERPWTLAKAAGSGDGAAQVRLREVLAELLEACRLLALAGAPFMPLTAPRVLAQLGHDYGYGADGNGGPPLWDLLEWGAGRPDPGRIGTPEPLFPRLEAEAATA